MITKKVISENELVEKIKDLRKKGKKIVFTNGCFDILHIGHIRYLNQAKQLGDILVVAINSDDSVKRIKGPERPIHPQDERAEIIAALGSVDFVTIFNEDNPQRIIEHIKPQVLVKGGDWAKEDIIGGNFVEAIGGKVVSIPYIKSTSTSKIIQRILDRYRRNSST